MGKPLPNIFAVNRLLGDHHRDGSSAIIPLAIEAKMFDAVAADAYGQKDCGTVSLPKHKAARRVNRRWLPTLQR